MFITKKHLSRRTLLRGMGVSMALPLLDSMIPAQTALRNTAASPISRLAAFYVPHGATMAQWTPAAEGRGFEFSPILKPLEAIECRDASWCASKGEKGEKLGRKTLTGATIGSNFLNM